MVALTPELAGNSLVIAIGGVIVSFGFSAYMLYLNWKQAKVQERQEVVIELLEKIEGHLNPNKEARLN